MDTFDLRELARLRQVEGLKIEEIAECMGVSASTIMRSLRRIRLAGMVTKTDARCH